jgi:hypothetical protein
MVLFSSLLLADTIPLDSIPPLSQWHLFQSETNPNHYVAVAKDSISGVTGSWYVLDSNNRKIVSPKLKKSSFVYFGGGFDFEYESGEWLYIPGGNSEYTAPGATLELILPGLIDPKHGREPLKKVEATEKLLEDIGLSQWLSETSKKDLGHKPSHVTKPTAPNSEILLIGITYDRNSEQKDPARALRDALQASGNRAIRVNDYFGDVSTLYVWAFEEEVKSITDWATKEIGVQPALIKGFESIAATKSLSDKQLYEIEMFDRLGPIVAGLDEIETNSAKLSGTEKEAAALRLANYLYTIEQMIQLNDGSASVLREYWNASGPAVEKLEKHFLAPLRSLYLRTCQSLIDLQNPVARKILLFTGSDETTRIPLLDRVVTTEGETLFEYWLAALKEESDWILGKSAQELEKFSGASHSGGILREFGFLSVEVRTFKQPGAKPAPYDMTRTFYPLRILGLKDSVKIREQIIRFVVEMDKVAEYGHQRQAKDRSEKISGNLFLTNLITSLPYAGAYSSENIPGYSRILYFTQAMEIVTELLNTSRVTISNTATYLSLLDSALALQKRVMGEFGVVPNAKVNSPELNALAEQATLLGHAIQVRMLRNVFLHPELGGDSAADALRPR